jgi:hypothetical protein
MIGNPVLRTVDPPDGLWRAAFATDPWAFSSMVEHGSGEVRSGLLSRHAAITRALAAFRGLRLERDIVRHQRRGRSRRGVGIIGVNWADSGEIAGPLAVVEIAPRGVFFDLRRPEDVADLRFHIEMDRELRSLVAADPSEGITDGVRRVLAVSGPNGVPCGGFLTLEGDEESWQIFRAGVGPVRSEQNLGGEYESYVYLLSVAADLGAELPVRPAPEVAREMIRRALSPAEYARSAASIDAEFDVNA